MKESSTRFPLPCTLISAGQSAFSRLALRPARIFLDALRIQKNALYAMTLLCLGSAAWAIPVPNSPISNTATASYTVGVAPYTRTGTSLVNMASCVANNFKIDLLQYIPASRAAQAGSLAVAENVQPGAYAPSGAPVGPFTALNQPTLFGSNTPTSLPASLLLAPLQDSAGKPLSSYTHNEPVFVRVISYDANLDAAAADTVTITLTTSGGDSEVVQLTETGNSTGEFIGAIPATFTLAAAPIKNNGQINITAHNETITAIYQPLNCNANNTASSSSGLVDPYGIVFDSITGAPIAGASVTLVDSASNAPATAYCDDGKIGRASCRERVS
jgi:hypothetical protein